MEQKRDQSSDEQQNMSLSSQGPDSRHNKSDAQEPKPEKVLHPFMIRRSLAANTSGDHLNSKLSSFTGTKLTLPPPGQGSLYLKALKKLDIHGEIGKGEGAKAGRNPFEYNRNKRPEKTQAAKKRELELACFISPLHSSFNPIREFLADHREKNKETSIPSIFQTCGQINPIPIELVFSPFKQVLKLSEGAYGEIFIGELYKTINPIPNVIKIVPVEGNEAVNDLSQKRFHEIESEIMISQMLTNLRDECSRNYTTGFSHLNCARVLKGKYPGVLVKAWKYWDQYKKSMNDCPDFEEDQLYVALESQFAGIDLTMFKFDFVNQMWSCLMQVIFSLAIAEIELEFEHRDLHWGNVLIERTEDQTQSFRLNDIPYKIPTHGIKAVIIDFTLSRAVDTNNNPIYTDLSKDEDQFTNQEDDYQFEIYRMMRTENRNDWNEFHPKTNVFWIHYLCKKLLDKGSRLPPSQSNFNAYKMIKDFSDTVLNYPSCSSIAKRQFDFIDRVPDKEKEMPFCNISPSKSSHNLLKF